MQGVALFVFFFHYNGVAAVSEQKLHQLLFLIETGWFFRLGRYGLLRLLGYIDGLRHLRRVDTELLAVFRAKNLVELVHQRLFGHLQSTAAFLDVCGAVDGVGDDRDGLDYVFDDAGFLDRVVFGVLQQQIGLETDEIFGVVGQIFCDVLDGVVLHEGVGVVFGRKNNYAYIHALFQNHVGATQRGMNACGVAVVEYGDVFGVAADHAHLLGGQRGARACHNVFYSSLVHRQNVGVSFN